MHILIVKMHNSSSSYDHSNLDIKTDAVRKITGNNSLNDNNLRTVCPISIDFPRAYM